MECIVISISIIIIIIIITTTTTTTTTITTATTTTTTMSMRGAHHESDRRLSHPGIAKSRAAKFYEGLASGFIFIAISCKKNKIFHFHVKSSKGSMREYEVVHNNAKLSFAFISKC